MLPPAQKAAKCLAAEICLSFVGNITIEIVNTFQYGRPLDIESAFTKLPRGTHDC